MQDDLLQALGGTPQGAATNLGGSFGLRERVQSTPEQRSVGGGGGGRSFGGVGASKQTQKTVAIAVLLGLCALFITTFELRSSYRGVSSLTRSKSYVQRCCAFLGAYLIAGRIEFSLAGRPFDVRWLVAVLSSVFSYREACIVSVIVAGLVFIDPLWVKASGSPSKATAASSNMFTAVCIVVQVVLMRTTWFFYRDVFSLLLAHSGKRSFVAYPGCALLLFFQVCLAISCAVYVAEFINELTGPSASIRNASDKAVTRVKESVPQAAGTSLVVVIIVSLWALQNNFPGTKSWFW